MKKYSNIVELIENRLNQIQQRFGKTAYVIFVAMFGLVLIYSRRPSIFRNPQFWAEDGKVWYADAYNFGLFRSLFMPQDGYFQTLSRIVADFSRLFDFSHAPSIFLVVAIFVQFLPILLIASGRLNNLMPKHSVRLLLIFVYIALPNTSEIFGNLTNAQWYLALAAALVLIAEEPRNWLWRVFDICCVTLVGLSGPFAIFLFPISLLSWLKTKKTWQLKLMMIIGATGLIQIVSVLAGSGRTKSIPEISTSLFFAILNRQVFMGLIMGSKGYVWLQNHFNYNHLLFYMTGIAGLLLTAYSFVKSKFQLKLFIIFSAMIFLGGLLSPTLTDLSNPAWQSLFRSTSGIRYWLIPMCGFLAVLASGLNKDNPTIVKAISGIFLASMMFGVVVDWRHEDLPDLGFASYVNIFHNASTGERVIIPVNPPGWSKEPWMMLVKK